MSPQKSLINRISEIIRPASEALDETTRELLQSALRFHKPELLRAFDDHAENRPVPDVDRVGNARRAA